MDYLQSFFNDGAITFEELQEKVKGSGAVKLANLADGKYVGIEKYQTLLQQKNALKNDLEEMHEKIKELEKIDVEKIQAEFEGEKLLAQEEVENYRNKIAAMEYSFAINEACKHIQFSSHSARKMFVEALKSENLPIENEKMKGFEEFLQKWKSDDPAAFTEEEVIPRFVLASKEMQKEVSWREKIGQNYVNAKN